MAGDITFTYIPTPKQEAFHRAKALHKLFGGAAGGGKTDALIGECLMLCKKYPGIKGLFIRRTYAEIEETINERLPKMFKDQDGNPATPYKIRKNVLHYNGSQIVLGYWQDDKRNNRYFSTEYDFIAVDEITRTIYKKGDLQKLLIRNRTSKARLHAQGFRPYFMAGTNPGGLGHGYIKEVFIDGKPWTGFDKKDFVFIPSKLEDNPHLLDNDPNYIRRLEGLADQNLKKAMRHGDRNVFEGQFFPERLETFHKKDLIVLDPMSIKRNILSLDYGYRKPSSVHRLRRDSEGIYYVTSELYKTGMTYDDLGYAIKEKYSGLGIEYIVADPAIFSKGQGRDKSGAEIIQAITGIPVVPGNNNRQAGRTLIKTLLKSDNLYIQTNCINLVREFGNAVYDDKKDNDLDTNGEDHALDDVRYGLMDIAGHELDKVDESVDRMNEDLERDEDDENLLNTSF